MGLHDGGPARHHVWDPGGGRTHAAVFKLFSQTATRSTTGLHERTPPTASPQGARQPDTDAAVSHEVPAGVASGDLSSADGYPGWQARFYDVWVADAL